MTPDKKKVTTDDKKEKKSLLLGLVFKFFKESINPKELSSIDKCLVKANQLAPSDYFMKLLRKTRIIWAVSASPSVLNACLLAYYFNLDNTVTREISKVSKMIGMAVNTKNPDALSNISIDPNFWIYLLAIVVQTIFLTSLSWLFMAVIKKVNPVIRESIELREYCIAKNYSTEQDDYFLVCKAGILARVSSSSGDDLVKDKQLWRHLNKIPKDPVESPKDRNIVFIGNGFQLQKYEFKIS